MKIAIAHDYLNQAGGAERVVADWSRSLPGAPIYVLTAADPLPYDLFDSADLRKASNNAVVTRHVEKFLPILPSLANRVRIADHDAALVSTSGWAHMFSYEVPTLAYVHSPARWLHEYDDYRVKLGSFAKLGLKLSRRVLLKSDRLAMERMTTVVANSAVSQRRIRSAYGRDADVVHPPVTPLQVTPEPPSVPIPAEFALVVARNRGYKGIGLAVDAARLAKIPIVIVGSGTMDLNAPDENVFGLGRVSDGCLRWLYQNCLTIVGAGSEDFGLTILEANLEGAPAAAIPKGGYLETVDVGRSGVLSDDTSAHGLAVALRCSLSLAGAGPISWAGGFSPETHMAALKSRLI